MNIKALLASRDFLNLNQFQKREKIETYILQDKFCKIGSMVICYDLESFVDDKYKWMYKQYGRPKKIKTLSIGTEYKIIDHIEGKIKILNDDGTKYWYSINRFLCSIKLQRAEKLKKINNINDISTM